MLDSEQTYHRQSATTKHVPRTEPSNSHFRERTTWISDIHPLGSTNEGIVSWKDFLEHSRFDHDATACAFCISNRLYNGVALQITPSIFPPATFPQQVAIYLSKIWSHQRSTIAKLRKAHSVHGGPGGACSLQPVTIRSVYESTVVADSPPLLPPLRPSPPMFRDFNLLT